MAIGDALARGILKGIGLGGQGVVEERRKDRREERQAEQAFKLFKDQTDYAEAKAAVIREEQRKYNEGIRAEDREWALQDQQTQMAWQVKMENMAQKNRIQLSNINAANSLKASKTMVMLNAHQKAFEQEIEIGKNFEMLATKTPQELAALKAHNFAKNFPKDQYGAMYNESLKNDANKSKALLIKELDGVQADYSRFEGIPEFKDAIPRMKSLAGVNMDEQFAYDPDAYVKQVNDELAGLTEGDRKRRDRDMSIETKALGTFGATAMSTEAKRIVRNAAPDGGIVTTPDGIQRDADLMNTEIYLQSGILVRTPDGQIVSKKEMDAIMLQAQAQQTAAIQAQQDAGMVGAGTVLAPQAPQEPSAPQPLNISGGEVGVDTQVTAELAKEKQKETAQKADATIKAVNKNDSLTNSSLLNDISTQLKSLGDAQFDVGATSVGISAAPAVRDVAAAAGNKDAIAAKDFLSKVALLRNQTRNELFGATLTQGEKAAFDEAWNELGVMTTREGYTRQLNNIRAMYDAKLQSVLAENDDETNIVMATRHPEIMRVYVDNIMKEQGIPEQHRAEVERRIRAAAE